MRLLVIYSRLPFCQPNTFVVSLEIYTFLARRKLLENNYSAPVLIINIELPAKRTFRLKDLFTKVHSKKKVTQLRRGGIQLLRLHLEREEGPSKCKQMRTGGRGGSCQCKRLPINF